MNDIIFSSFKAKEEKNIINIYCNENDQDNPYIKSILRYNKKVMNDQFKFLIRTHNQFFVRTLIEEPSIVLRPYSSYVVFKNPICDLEGYHTYFNSGSVFVPPVVKAIISSIDLNETSYTIVGSGIGIYLASELKKLNMNLELITHNELRLLTKEEIISKRIINCSRASVDGCLINLCDNPSNISKETVKNLFFNIERAL